MSAVSFPLTTVHKYVKLFQYAKETGAYAITPASASFIDASFVTGSTTSKTNISEVLRKLGRRTMYKYLKMGTENTFSISFSPVDTALMRYASENPSTTATPIAGTLDESLTMVNSILANNTTTSGSLIETFVIRRGCKCNSMTVTTSSRGMLVVDQDWICSTITSSQAAFGGMTTPSFVSSPTTLTPWSNLSGGCVGKLIIGGVNYPFKTASFTVNNNLAAVDVDGCDAIAGLEPGAKEVTFTADILIQKDLGLETAMDAGTGLPATLVLNASAPAKSATFTELFISEKTEEEAADDTDVKVATYSGTATDVTITA